MRCKSNRVLKFVFLSTLKFQALEQALIAEATTTVPLVSLLTNYFFVIKSFCNLFSLSFIFVAFRPTTSI